MDTPSISSIVLAVLDFLSIFQFLIGGLLFWKITKKISNKHASNLALMGTISSFTGGLPNACDKLHWVFGADTFFESSWMFVFVGIGFSLMFASVLLLCKDKKHKTDNTAFSVVIPTLVILSATIFPKPVKYIFMLIATVCMVGYYSHTYRIAKKYIGKIALWYLFAICMTLVLSVISSVCKNFTIYWPNILAQTSNNIAYIGFVYANRKWLKKLSEK